MNAKKSTYNTIILINFVPPYSGLRKPLKDQFTTICILFYCIVCHSAQKSFPVGQMLSQMHTMEWLIHWMQTWKPTKVELLPHEIIMDESSALIGAAVMVFTQDKSTFQYIDRCINLKLKKNVDLPECYIRIDRSHFVKSIHRNLRKGDAKTTRLLRGVLGYLISCSDLREFEKIMKYVFTLIRNKFISTSVAEAISKLVQLVRTHELIIDELFLEFDGIDGNVDAEENVDTKFDGIDENVDAEFEMVQGDSVADVTSHKHTSSYRWVMSFYDSVEISGDDMPQNIYFAPKFEKYLIHTFVRSPLWSNLMMKEFNSENDYATSTPVKNEFKTIKKLLDFKKYRVDSFMNRHFSYLNGQMKIRKAVQNEKVSLEQRKRSNSFDVCDLKKPQIRRSSSLNNLSMRYSDSESDDALIMEDWRNKVKNSSQLPKSTRSRRAVNSILSKHDPEYFRSDIKLLTNGYESPSFFTWNTCCFDSIYPIMCVAYSDYDLKQQFSSDDPFSTFIRGILEAPKSLTQLYNLRNEILYEIFSSDAYLLSNNIKETAKPNVTKKKMKIYIDCHTGLAGFFSMLNIASYVENGICKCGEIRNARFPLIQLKVNFRKPIDLTNIQDNIIQHNKERVCDMCQCPVEVTRNLQDIIAFEVEPPIKMMNISAIGDIQDSIILQNQQFDLFGVIEFIPGIKHFVAFVKRKNELWERFDDLKNARIIRVDPARENVDPFMLFYKKN